MLNYLLRRLLQSIPILLGITFLVFLLFHVAGGNPVYQMLGKNASPEEVALLTRQMGLDRPLWAQYLHYLGDLASFDFGRSWETKQRISEMLADGLGPSLALAIPAFLATTAASLGLAMGAALFRGRWPDRALMAAAVLGMSVSILAFIIGAQYIFAFRFDLFPISGYETGWAGLPYLALPVLIWVVAGVGQGARYYRSVFLEELNRDYVIAARAKGLSMRQVMLRHVLKNAMIPVITRLAMELPLLFTGSLLLENFFGIPGLGNMSIRAINASDLPVIQAMTFFGSALYLGANVLGDFLYGVFDPRVRLK